MMIIYSLFVFTLASLSLTDAEIIRFQSTPLVIQPVLSKHLTLRCSVQDGSSVRRSFGSIFQEMIGPNTTAAYERVNTTYPHLNVTHVTADHVTVKPPITEADVAHVTSIIINKVNRMTNSVDKVADVTPFEAASAGSHFLGLVSVEGNSERSPKQGEKAYLQVKWDYPDYDQAGEYSCEIFGLDSNNLPVSLESALLISSKPATMSDLINYISIQQKVIDNLKAQNIQKGTSNCNTNGYSNQITFSNSFKTPPLVFTTFSDINTGYYTQQSVHWNVTITTVTETYFNYSCIASPTSFIFDWVAIDN
ncbi:DSC-2 [Biomphalaria glabrata]|nr:DSC-2 [Biomphalaria glabrata]